MPANRCSSCLIYYPPRVARCHVCGAVLQPVIAAVPDADWEDQVRERLGTGSPKDMAVTAWRLDRLLALQVSEALAELAAETPGLDWHRVRDLVERGCDADTAVLILI